MLDYLIDNFGRRITYIRFSVTPRCNFNCVYCNSHTGETDKDEEFSTKDIEFLFSVMPEVGVKKVRLTGGEPLLRHDILDIVKALKKDKIQEIVLTTNGFYLSSVAEALREAGLTRVNVSLDTLNRDTFVHVTGVDALDIVNSGIKEAIKYGLTPVKINTVLMRGINEKDILPIAELTLNSDITVRFIELMPVKDNNFWKMHYINFRTALALIKKKYELIKSTGGSGEVASYYRIKGAPGKIGFITPISQHFCKYCNRIRITAKGEIYPCLFSKEYISIRDAVKDRNKDLLVSLIRKSVDIKPKEHGVISLSSQDFINNMRELGG